MSGSKVALSDGSVAQILEKRRIPRMIRVAQSFDGAHVEDIEAEVALKLTRPGTLDRVCPGMSIAVTVGSRGIPNNVRIVKTLIAQIKGRGAFPFIVPAMGSHGGATDEGQVEMLDALGFTEQEMGCPVRSSMQTEKVGVTPNGLPVFVDKNALSADGIVITNRIKSHTAYRDVYESGLMKIMAIGLGKQKGAEVCHSQGFGYVPRNVAESARVILEECNILFGLGVVDNAYDQTRRIEAIPSELIPEEEPPLLKDAAANLPQVLLDEIDVLAIREIGKDINGDCMDPNVTGSFATPYASGGVKKQRLVVLDLTEATHGNANGWGMADFTTQRAFDKMDFEKTYPNCLTSTVSLTCKTPVVLANDSLAIKAGIHTCNGIDHDAVRLALVKNTLELSEILVSESLLDQVLKNPRLRVLGNPEELRFDETGYLI